MNTNILKILFLISATRINKKGLVPIICRITYYGKRKPFSTGLFINPKHWDSKQQKTKPPNEENTFVNTQLSLIKQKINQAFLFLQVQEKDFEVEDIYLQYIGEPIKEDKTILKLFQEHNDKMEKLIGKEYSIGTLWKFKQSFELLKGFIKFQFKKNDYPFKNLDLQFVQDYEFYLKTEKNLAPATTNKAIQRFRKIIKIAISQGILDKDPFMDYKVKHIKKQIVYLTTEELSKLENYHFKAERLQQVADMFVFCCYTGLAYNEMANLEEKHIIKGFDGNNWIKMIREKTQKQISIPLLPKSSEILVKYQSKVKNDKLLPLLSNQKFNAYLKEIADIVGIDKNLTHHIARKTFATTVLLYNDVPMEIVSELLGHSKISVTQEHYAKVVQKKVSEQMQILQKKLK
ncbi:site-specific integrase [Riemerella anatipestifer]|uniref:site-specific integrase n=1 Tax=Riemerella anatipestifer TaxID=34085 RepID=UPI001374D80B|nr:site-specific integrase [Riemerella anatipestifer]MDY3521062.1 site-specific integrase [Riemerella anatipestifer]MDY3533177.1 site-specific integrase [Riemerella anatipestifer]MDY3535357.1 site-specific integrase [Riemerella anatipestifer]